MAEIAPSKLLEFWDAESLSRKCTSTRPSDPSSIDISDVENIVEEEVEVEKEEEIKIVQKTTKKTPAFAQLGLKSKPVSIGALLAEAGFEGRHTLDRRDLLDKRSLSFFSSRKNNR